jgi:hypothetical protein
MTREQALKEMKKEIYSPQELEDDIQYIAKKLDITPEELKNIISNGKNKTYKDYPNNEQLFSVGINIRNALRKLTNK